MDPMLCPNCKTNRTRFNLIKQQVLPVKLNPQSGEIEEEYTDYAGPFHMMYHGPTYRIQCATCGLIEDMDMFTQMAKNYK